MNYFTKLLCQFFIIVVIWESTSCSSVVPEYDYVRVRPGAYMFWMLYHTTSYADKPLIIWLQGGPGVSGTAYGNFEEIGPHDSKFQPRNHTWIKDYNVLFIDSPVGTGFSYVENGEAYCRDNLQIAKDLLVTISSFLLKYPKFRVTPTFLFGESYGGKMAVEFANLWYQEQKKHQIASHLKGVGLIDSLISPKDSYESMPPYLFNLGLIDSVAYKQLNNAVFEFTQHSDNENWIDAYRSAVNVEKLIKELTFGVDYYHVTSKVEQNHTPINYSPELKDTMKKIKDHFKLKSEWSVQERWVKYALHQDVKKPAVDLVEKILTETDLKLFVLNGQLDLIINTPGTLNWLEKLNWRYGRNWYYAPRVPLVINNAIEGYSKGYGNLKFYSVYRSGHEIPMYNPVAMEYILRDLIYGIH